MNSNLSFSVRII